MTPPSPSTRTLPRLGIGIGWRPELALAIDRRRPTLGFVEILAEDFDPARPVPDAIANLLDRGVRAVPHGISLSLGGAEPVDPARVDRLAKLATRLGSPFVSEHIAFVRAAGVEAGHLLPVPRTRRRARRARRQRPHRQAAPARPARAGEHLRPVRVAGRRAVGSRLPHRSPGADRFADAARHRQRLGQRPQPWRRRGGGGGDPVRFLERIPLHRLAYVHVAGGVERDGVYHDTHTAAVPAGVLELLEELCAASSRPASCSSGTTTSPTRRR